MFSITLWSLKIQLWIKIFMWYIKREVVLMKDNLERRNWEGNRLCTFCANHELIQHLFFLLLFCYVHLEGGASNL
jgi:hypothetical protein